MNKPRRRFGMMLGALAATAASVSVQAKPAVAPRLIKPPRLRQGDMVGLIAPGGYMDDVGIEKSVRNLESIGLVVKMGANIRAVRGGYAGTVKQRLADLHDMFADREVKAVWTARGGSGCTGLLPAIDYGLIRRHPKILIGYSDITVLNLAIFRMTGLVTFHGPVAWSSFSDYSVNHMLSVLMDPSPEYAIHMSIENERRAQEQSQYLMRTIRPGVAAGRLMGGNLSMVCALIGTRYAAELKNSLLFLEDVSEPPYKIDRMLTQLEQSANLAAAAGAMLGVFEREKQTPGEHSLTMNEVIDDHFAALKIPSVYGYSFGHIRNQFTLPLGVRARLDTDSQTLTLLEPAVQ